MNKQDTNYLIIGNSAGGIGAVEAIRAIDKNGSILMISDEPYHVYSRPMISEYLAGSCSFDNMMYRPVDFYEKNKVQLITGKKVRSIASSENMVHLNHDMSYAGQKLLIATGAEPVLPQIEGIDRDGVFTFTTLDDAIAIDRYLENVSAAVVIGGGLIGVSVTEALVERGIKVSIIEMQEHILSTILDPEISGRVAAVIERNGVEMVTGRTAQKITGKARHKYNVEGVILDDGTEIPCQMVIAAIGVRPRAALAVEAGLEVKRGIIVDRHMRTSSPDIFACGDVVESYDFAEGKNRVIPIWPNAYMGGRVAGFTMAGENRQYQNITSRNALKYFGIAAVSAGIINPANGDYEILINENGNSYKKIVLKNGQIKGLLFYEDIDRVGIVLELMNRKVDVTGFKDELVSSELKILDLPDGIQKNLLATARIPAGSVQV